MLRDSQQHVGDSVRPISMSEIWVSSGNTDTPQNGSHSSVNKACESVAQLSDIRLAIDRLRVQIRPLTLVFLLYVVFAHVHIAYTYRFLVFIITHNWLI